MRLGRSRHSLQAASEDQNLQAERSSDGSSELSTQQILVPVSPLTQIFLTQKFSQARSLRDTLAQKEAKEQAEIQSKSRWQRSFEMSQAYSTLAF